MKKEKTHTNDERNKEAAQTLNCMLVVVAYLGVRLN